MADLNLILTIAFAFGLALGNSIAFLSVACQEKKSMGYKCGKKNPVWIIHLVSLEAAPQLEPSRVDCNFPASIHIRLNFGELFSFVD